MTEKRTEPAQDVIAGRNAVKEALRRRNKALFWGLRLGAAALAGAGIALLAVAL